MTTPRNVVVVGMPSSGTSLAAAVFARRGYHIGEVSRRRSREGDEHNPFGYFEADDLIERNVALLRRAGFGAHNTWRFEPISDEVCQRLAAMPIDPTDLRFVARYDANSPWVWKDPRLCYTLAYWSRLHHPDRTAVLLVRRSPDEVLHWSFRRMDWCSADESDRADLLRRIEHHLAAARRALVGLAIPHREIDYADFLERPRHVARTLGALVGLSLTPADLNARAELDDSRSGRARIATRVRIPMLHLPKPARRWMRERAPRRLLAALFPEWRHVREPGRVQPER